MAIVGFNFLRIEAVRNSAPSGQLNVNNNISITDIKESELSLGGSKQKGVRFLFDFIAKYEPGVGSISLMGEVTYLGTETEVKNLLKGWKDKKEIPKKIRTEILNLVLTKCNIQSLILSQDINLPPPVQLPRIRDDEQ